MSANFPPKLSFKGNTLLAIWGFIDYNEYPLFFSNYYHNAHQFRKYPRVDKKLAAAGP